MATKVQKDEMESKKETIVQKHVKSSEMKVNRPSPKHNDFIP